MIVRINKLRNLLKKWRAGLISVEEVVSGFEEVLDVSVSAAIDFDTYREELRNLGWDELKLYQEKNVKAAKAIAKRTRKGFKKATVLINEGKNIRGKLWEIIQISFQYKKAAQVLKELEFTIDSHWRKQMPSIILLYHFLEESLKKINEHRFVEARVLLNSFISDIKEMNNVESDKTEVKTTLLDRINQLENICKETMSWSQYCHNQPQIEVTSKEKQALEELLENNYVQIATKIIDDLEILLSQRIAFHKILIQQKEFSISIKLNLQTALKNHSWEGGGFMLLQNEIRNQNNLYKI